mmetsp:Transcript_32291/g.82291  ORF Transcript_32291/g.82291 Transcript_32291/m.82291 type:complete len:105 (-) Transcript_32291:1353-1667(-)
MAQDLHCALPPNNLVTCYPSAPSSSCTQLLCLLGRGSGYGGATSCQVDFAAKPKGQPVVSGAPEAAKGQPVASCEPKASHMTFLAPSLSSSACISFIHADGPQM